MEGGTIIKIAICDDDKIFLDKMEEYIIYYMNDCSLSYEIYKYTSGIELLEALNENFQIIFLDIQMPGLDGMEVAKFIRHRDKTLYLVFTTSYMNCASKGYEVYAENFMIKPINKMAIDTEMNRAILKQTDRKDSIMVRNNDGFYKVLLSEIIFIETGNRNTLVHTISGIMKSFCQMQTFENQLTDSFFRCHKSYIVNMNFIKSIEDLCVSLRTEDVIFVSKNRKRILMQAMASYYGSSIV